MKADQQLLWDEESVYDEKISPLMKQIIAICKEHQIPLVAKFQIANHEDGPFFATTSLPFDRACDAIRKLSVSAMPVRAIALAETHVTNADGSKTVLIRSV